MGKRVLLTVSILFLAFCSSLLAVNVYVGPTINQVPTSAKAGDNIQFQCGLTAAGGLAKSIHINVKVDNNVIYDYTYPQLENTSTSINVNWTATTGSHTVKFKVIGVDPSTPDTTPSNNVVTKNFTIAPGATMVNPTQTLTGTFAQPGPMTGLTTSRPNLQLNPCFVNRNGTTDLSVNAFEVTKASATQWKIKLQIKNSGPKCVKTLVWEVKNLGHPVTQQRLGNLTNPGWLLQGNGDVYLVEKIVTADQNPPSWTDNGLIWTRFTVTIDSYNDVVETNEGNNTATDDLNI